MNDRHYVRKPKEGLNTLIAEFTFLHFDAAIEEIKKLRSEGFSEKELISRIEHRYSDTDERTRKKIYQLSLDVAPRDDFSDEELASRVDQSDTTVEVELKSAPDEYPAGAVVFFEGRRWVVSSVKDGRIVLKHF